MAHSRVVSNGYFQTMHIPLLAGQGCVNSLNPRAVVNRSFADKYLSESRAVGHHLEEIPNPFGMAPSEIRGIVADAREEGLNRSPIPTIYWCASAPTPSPLFLVRTQGDPITMAEAVRHKIHQLDPSRSVFDISPLEQHLSDNLAEDRLRTVLLALFAVTAILLASVGVYGTLSYFVTLRKREVGLRLALGALRGQIVTQFLLKGLSVSMLGCAAGLCLAAAFSRGLTGLLYGVSTTDPQTWVTVVLLVLSVAALASFLPSIRAAQLEPMQVLRDE
ncbi:MAG: FtsX-like permease family protein [Acidobacteriaceae bacterium]|nr:FtsX-like permease family protein [Acidobacteriaceae bacterium]MBV9778746.1 FtsX-like permease family protein [Acidobacteriaceae bacterium]